MKTSNQNINTYSGNFNSISRMKISNDSKFVDPYMNKKKEVKGNTKNTKVKINGKKVFINIRSFYKETKTKNKKFQTQINLKPRNNSINKENMIEKHNRNSFYQTKNYLKYNSINSGQNNRNNLTGHANILVNKKNVKNSAQKLRGSENKRKYTGVKTSVDISREFIKMNSRRRIMRKY